MTSAMPMIASGARGLDSASRGGAPGMPSKPFFDPTNQSSWISVTSAPPAGAWQLAPAGLANPFALGNERLYGEAVYTPRDRKMTAANGPEVVVVQAHSVHFVPGETAINFVNFQDGLDRTKLTRCTMLKAGCFVVFGDRDGESTLVVVDNLVKSDDVSEAFADNNIPARCGFVAADIVFEPPDRENEQFALPIIVQGEVNIRTGAPETEFRCGESTNIEHCLDLKLTVMQADSSTKSDMCKVYIH